MRIAVPVLAALALAGCRDTKPASSGPSPQTAGPVNPDPGLTTYACVDGQRITAGYPDEKTAIVTYKGHAYTLQLARSADGARYIGYGLQWWTRGSRAAIVALKPGEDVASAAGLDCMAEGPPAAVVTHTAFPAGARRSP